MQIYETISSKFLVPNILIKMTNFLTILLKSFLYINFLLINFKYKNLFKTKFTVIININFSK